MLVAETLVILAALKQVIQENYSKIIIKSDWLITIQDGKSIPTKQICNLVEDINMLPKKFGMLDLSIIRDL